MMIIYINLLDVIYFIVNVKRNININVFLKGYFNMIIYI